MKILKTLVVTSSLFGFLNSAASSFEGWFDKYEVSFGFLTATPSYKQTQNYYEVSIAGTTKHQELNMPVQGTYKTLKIRLYKDSYTTSRWLVLTQCYGVALSKIKSANIGLYAPYFYARRPLNSSRVVNENLIVINLSNLSQAQLENVCKLIDV